MTGYPISIFKSHTEKGIFLTRNELIWLHERGGRTAQDVNKDENGKKYVIMWDGNYKKSVHVYL